MSAQPIYVGETEKKALLSFYEEELVKLDIARERILNNIAILKGSSKRVVRDEALIVKDSLSRELDNSELIKDASNYPYDGSWERRICFVLRELDKPSLKNTIYSQMLKYEPSLKDEEKGTKNSVAATLSRISGYDNGSITKVDSQTSAAWYALREWYDENGKLLKNNEEM